MLFKFPSSKMFYFNNKMSFTKDNGEYILDKELLDFVYSELGKDIGKEEIYQYLLDHTIIEKETVVQPHGNSARLSVPKIWIGKHVKYWIAILPDIERE